MNKPEEILERQVNRRSFIKKEHLPRELQPSALGC